MKMVNIMCWCSPADVMDRVGAMCELIGQCRFGRLTGVGGIAGRNPDVPISNAQLLADSVLRSRARNTFLPRNV
jgi:hypothetical protein